MIIFQNIDYSIVIHNEDDNYWMQEAVAVQVNKIRPFIYMMKLYEDIDHLPLSFKNISEFWKFSENLFKNKEKIINVLKREVKPIIKELENGR